MSKGTVFLLALLPVACFGIGTEPEDDTGLRYGGKIYVVIGVLAIIWLGFGVYLALIERKLNRIEKDRKKLDQND